MTDRKRIYIRRCFFAVLFFLGLAALLTVVSFIFSPKDNTEEAGMEEVFANGILGEPEDTIDVLVAGDSYSYTSTIPPQIWKEAGITSYASGTNDQSLDYTLVMLKRAFRTQNPKVVLLEASPIYREITPFGRLTAELSSVFPVFHYHDRWKSLRGEDFTRRPEYTLTKDYKGYKYFTKIVPAPDTDNMVKTDDAEPVPESSRYYMKKILKFCQDHGAVLVLMSAPNRTYWNYSRHNGISALAEELGCDYIDANLTDEEIGIDWEHDTCDGGDHLNHAGSVKATQFVTGYLTSLGILEDHRGDPKYSHWDKALKKYEKQVRKEDI